MLAMFAGVLLTASNPPINLSYLSWFALIPLLKSLEGKSSSQALKLGFIAGGLHYLTLIYWITVVLGRYGGLNMALSTIPYLLFCVYLALFPAVFSFLISNLKESRFFSFFMAALWVTLEFTRANLFTGFPWCLLGHTQFEQLHVIQISDITGTYGISFLIAMTNGLLYQLFFRQKNIQGGKPGIGFRIIETFMVVFFTCVILGYGFYRLSDKKKDETSHQKLRIAVIQGNIDQSLKWDPDYQEKTLDTYLSLTRKIRGFKPDLILWPETALPFFFQDNETYSPRVMSLVQKMNTGLIFGSPAYRNHNGKIFYYNRAYLLSTHGRRMQYYDKAHLVPFGEYVPLKKYLSFINRLVPAAGDFAEGNEIKPMKFRNLSIGVTICFEAIFPELSSMHVKKNADILVNLTNDAWFGKTGAPWQHLAMAVFRTVENRRPLIRAANTGISAIIDANGKIIKQGGLFYEETLTGVIDIRKQPKTFYTRFGDVFALMMMGITFFRLIFIFRKKRLK